MFNPLPVFIHPKNKIFWGGMSFVFSFALYLVLNHFHLFQPQLLPWLWPDEFTPFLPLSLWIYLSIYPMMFLALRHTKDLINFTKYFYASVAHFVLTAFIFFFWPTSYPRDAYPLPADLDILTRTLFNIMRAADTPANCCPSLHVSCAFLTAFLFIEEKREKFPFFFIWASLVAFSTMTTKQHYFLDVLGGCFMAMISYVYFYNYCDYQESPRVASLPE